MDLSLLYTSSHHPYKITSANYGLRLLAQFYTWCNRVFQRSRTNKRLDIGKDTDRFITRNSLIWLWRLRSPRSAISKLETLESRCCGFTPKNQGSQWCESQTKGRKKWTFQLNRLREWLLPASLFLFQPGLQRMWVMPTHTREGHMFLSVYWFKCWSHPETHSQTHLEIMFN